MLKIFITNIITSLIISLSSWHILVLENLLFIFCIVWPLLINNHLTCSIWFVAVTRVQCFAFSIQNFIFQNSIYFNNLLILLFCPIPMFSINRCIHQTLAWASIIINVQVYKHSHSQRCTHVRFILQDRTLAGRRDLPVKTLEEPSQLCHHLCHVGFCKCIIANNYYILL